VNNIFRGFGAVFYKEALHVRRDAGTLFFSLTMPLLQMFLLGFAIDTNIRQINTVVYNAMPPRSRELLDRFRNSDTFHVIQYVDNDHDLNDLIIAGKARVGIKIPVDYSDRLLHQMSAQVLVLIDGSDSSVAGQAITYPPQSASTNPSAASCRTAPRSPSTCAPSFSSIPIRARQFFLPGLTAIMLLNVTTFLTAFSIVREKERGTLEQLFVTPVRPFGLLLGKLLPYLFIGFFELCLILAFMRFVFLVPIHGISFCSRFFRCVSLCRALAWHSHFQQSIVPGRSYAARFSSILPSVFFSGYIFRAKPFPLFCTA